MRSPAKPACMGPHKFMRTCLHGAYMPSSAVPACMGPTCQALLYLPAWGYTKCMRTCLHGAYTPGSTAIPACMGSPAIPACMGPTCQALLYLPAWGLLLYLLAWGHTNGCMGSHKCLHGGLLHYLPAWGLGAPCLSDSCRIFQGRKSGCQNLRVEPDVLFLACLIAEGFSKGEKWLSKPAQGANCGAVCIAFQCNFSPPCAFGPQREEKWLSDPVRGPDCIDIVFYVIICALGPRAPPLPSPLTKQCQQLSISNTPSATSLF